MSELALYSIEHLDTIQPIVDKEACVVMKVEDRIDKSHKDAKVYVKTVVLYKTGKSPDGLNDFWTKLLEALFGEKK